MSRKKAKGTLLKDFLLAEYNRTQGGERVKISHARSVILEVDRTIFNQKLARGEELSEPTVAEFLESYEIVIVSHGLFRIRHRIAQYIVYKTSGCDSLVTIQEILQREYRKKLPVVDERDQSKVVKISPLL